MFLHKRSAVNFGQLLDTTQNPWRRRQIENTMYSASRSLVLSNSRRSVTQERTRSSTSKQTRSYVSTQTGKRNYLSFGAFAAATAGTSCVMCQSIRLTSACSASSMLQYRGLHGSTATNTSTSLNVGANNRYYYSRSPPCFGNGPGISAPSPNSVGSLVSCSKKVSSVANVARYGLPNNVSSSQVSAFHSSSRVLSAPLLLGGEEAASQQLGRLEEIVSSGWASRVGALVVVAAAGSIFLNPIDRLRGSGGGGGGGGGGDPNSGGNGGGGQHDHYFESLTKDGEEETTKLSVGVTVAPKPYEVSELFVYSGWSFPICCDVHTKILFS